MQYLAHYLVAITALNAGSVLAAPTAGKEDCDTWAGQTTDKFKAFNKAVATSSEDNWRPWKNGNWYNPKSGITDTSSSPDDSDSAEQQDQQDSSVVVESVTETVVAPASDPTPDVKANFVQANVQPSPEADNSDDSQAADIQSEPEPITTTQAPTPTPTPTPTPSPSNSNNDTGSGSAPNSQDQAGLDATNQFRAAHSANPLVWDSRLADAAAQLANTCVWGHNTELGGGGYGQNLYGGGGSIADAVGAWADEAKDYGSYYGAADPPSSVFGAVGHFTQLVWKDTTKMGCAKSACNNAYGGMVVCNYEPAGNFGGQYANNVAAKK